MKIRTNLSNNFLKIYSESRGISIFRKNILRYNRVYSLNYITLVLLVFAFFMITGYIGLFSANNILSSVFFSVIIVLDCLYLFIKFLLLLFNYESRYKRDFYDEIIIDENGISNESFYGIKMTFKWSKIRAVVIKKYCVVILTDTPIYFFFNIYDEKKILKAIERYHRRTRIIR